MKRRDFNKGLLITASTLIVGTEKWTVDHLPPTEFHSQYHQAPIMEYVPPLDFPLDDPYFQDAILMSMRVNRQVLTKEIVDDAWRNS